MASGWRDTEIPYGSHGIAVVTGLNREGGASQDRDAVRIALPLLIHFTIMWFETFAH
ncbi:hypothetical protein G3I60_04210 [Streptomyces sp. SID13666]|uniref:hypothetical protein n=1 Tax=Streptomyces TaxID=1883 RepID=UPI0013C0E0EE|nr:MULTISPECIES: hypothetical protein [Streptomyces]MCZ4096898.1 hypothetical protein [Streptomyces sp. H39-C1]NEA53385.1 hypothetical protein [Streptomyces sp. SID13666]NEA69288.1 hypothetical protein [Streptomyces sp. SID13588]QNA70744.1 hypothetical protein C8250_001205 [Streptomyces sp. So13.3]